MRIGGDSIYTSCSFLYSKWFDVSMRQNEIYIYKYIPQAATDYLTKKPCKYCLFSELQVLSLCLQNVI